MKLKQKKGEQKTEYITLEADGSDVWRAQSAVDQLLEGKVGVIPTDTGYSFVTRSTSKEGIQRLLEVIGQAGQKKPLSLLCSDLSEASDYISMMKKSTFKLLNSHLPGPYTFIMSTGPGMPKINYGKKKWKRKTVGIRIPDDPVGHWVLEQVDEPLFCATVHLEEEDGARRIIEDLASMSEYWDQQVDFIVDAGERPADDTTIYDLSEDEFELVREGLGPPIKF